MKTGKETVNYFKNVRSFAPAKTCAGACKKGIALVEQVIAGHHTTLSRSELIRL